MLTTALENASPSPALLMEPWEPPLKARKPKSRMRKPRQTKGIEWPGIPPVFVHLSVLDRTVLSKTESWTELISKNKRLKLSTYIVPGAKNDTSRQRENSARKMNHCRSSKINETPEIDFSQQCLSITEYIKRFSLLGKPSKSCPGPVCANRVDHPSDQNTAKTGNMVVLACDHKSHLVIR